MIIKSFKKSSKIYQIIKQNEENNKNIDLNKKINDNSQFAVGKFWSYDNITKNIKEEQSKNIEKEKEKKLKISMIKNKFILKDLKNRRLKRKQIQKEKEDFHQYEEYIEPIYMDKTMLKQGYYYFEYNLYEQTIKDFFHIKKDIKLEDLIKMLSFKHKVHIKDLNVDFSKVTNLNFLTENHEFSIKEKVVIEN